MELKLNGVIMSNVKKYKKGENVKLSKNFHLKEWQCSCSDCEEVLVDLDHVLKLQQLREDLNASITITSAYRCPSHNAAVGGASHSQHKLGAATDLQVSGMSPDEVADACEKFNGLGRYNSFTHIDSRSTTKARWDKRTQKDYLPAEPTEIDIDISLDDIEKDLGL